MMDKICKKYTLEETKSEDGFVLRYTKYKTLDLSKLNKVTIEDAGFTAIPKWILQCINIKILDLYENKIKSIQKDDLPSSLIELMVKKNCLESVDVSNLVLLQRLELKANQLTSINLSNCDSLKELSIRNNQLTEIDYLPPTL